MKSSFPFVFGLELTTKTNPGPVRHEAKSAGVGMLLEGVCSLIKREAARSPALYSHFLRGVMPGAAAAILRL